MEEGRGLSRGRPKYRGATSHRLWGLPRESASRIQQRAEKSRWDLRVFLIQNVTEKSWFFLRISLRFSARRQVWPNRGPLARISAWIIVIPAYRDRNIYGYSIYFLFFFLLRRNPWESECTLALFASRWRCPRESGKCGYRSSRWRRFWESQWKRIEWQRPRHRCSSGRISITQQQSWQERRRWKWRWRRQRRWEWHWRRLPSGWRSRD